MIPEEKAHALTDSFNLFVEIHGNKPGEAAYSAEVMRKNAKACALICVEEIIEQAPLNPYSGTYYEITSDRVDEAVSYWEKVKKAIQSL